MKLLRVLLFTVTFGVGSGVNSFIMIYFRNLNHDKVKIDILAYKKSPTGPSSYINEIETKGGKVFLLPSIKKPIQHISEIIRILRDGQYDIVHNNSLAITIPLMIICNIMGVKIRILHSHATMLGETKIKAARNKLLLPFLKMSCNNYVGCSTEAGKTNVVDHNSFVMTANHRMETRSEERVSKKVVVITVGRACEQKNPIFALQIIKCLIDSIPDIVYWWIGDGPLLDQMQMTVKKLNIEDNVKLWGKQSNVRKLYEAADVFFLPSLFEGLPLTGIEAQAMGLPSVVSDTITKEMVYTDLVEFVSLKANTNVWVDVFKNQIQRISLRRSYAEELENSIFSVKNAGQHLEDYYRNILEKVSNT